MSTLPFDPFSEENLEKLFTRDLGNPNCVIAHEIHDIEFKENFNTSSINEYARVIASFANNHGGYLIFGIHDASRELRGMTNEQFERLTPEDFTDRLNQRLSPEIKWKRYVHYLDEKKFGIIYTYECAIKPVIARTGDNPLREGDIYYRYGARTERIKYPELHAIIEQRQAAYHQKWIDLIQNVAKFGVENAAILNLLDGEASGPNGKFIIPSELLDQISFIREGQFTETDGDPTLRVIGDAEAVDTNVLIEKEEVAITLKDIIHVFLDQKQVGNPNTYIKQMSSVESGFMPIYYFMNIGTLSKSDVINILESQVSRAQGKKGLIKRLKEGDYVGKKIKIGKRAESSIKTQNFYNKLINQDLDLSVIKDYNDICCLLKSIRMLEKEDIIKRYLFPMLKYLFDRYYDKDTGVADQLRRAICYIDYLLYRD